MNKLFVFVLALSSYCEIVAQSISGRLFKVVPPSPNVASLGKYGEVPVGLYTGIPNISIPLYEIKDGSLELPITLSYHAGGIKVEEIASSVGLGWTLNASGVIGRNVRGLPDEVAGWESQGQTNSIENIMLSNNYNQMQKLVKDVDAGYRDGEADIYYYNFNQFTGKFFYDQNGVVQTLPARNLLITNLGNGWKVTSEDGTVYMFTKVEEVRSADCSGDKSINAAWFLTSIKSLDGKRAIRFDYEQVNYTYQTLIGQTKYFSVNGTGNLCLQNAGPCLGSQNYNTHKLVGIDFGNGYIKIDYNNERCDLTKEKSLDEISVYSRNNQLIKRYKFRYSYFGNNGDGCNFFTSSSKRLKLVSLTEEIVNSQKPPFTFEYNELISLPDRLSYAQDHWGYYNGRMANHDLIASFTNIAGSGAQVHFPGADRRANPETAQAGILSKIKYPTGGETLFTYESNAVSDKRVELQTTQEVMTFGASNYAVSNLPVPYESSELFIPAPGAQIECNISGISYSAWANCEYVKCFVIKDNETIPFRQIDNSWNGVTELWPAGRYKLRLDYECYVDAIANFSVSIKAQIPDPPTLNIKPVGGLRIKQIEDRSGIVGQSIIKKYRYHLENDPKQSSGILINFPDYSYDFSVEKINTDENGTPQGPPILCQYKVRQSFSNYPLATTQGSYVGYSHVIEDLGEYGESRHSFNVYPDMPGEFPFAPVESFDWARGFLLNTKHFSRRNDALILAKETSYSPTSINQLRVYGIKTGKTSLFIWGGMIFPDLQPLPKYTFYPTITEMYALGQKKEKLYDQIDPTKFIETVVDYTYSPKHLQLVQTKTVTSRSDQVTNEEIISNKKYSFDYNFSNSPLGQEALGIKNLQELHAADAVIEEYTIKQSRNVTSNELSDMRVVGGGITTYKSDRPYPDKVFQLQIGSPIPSINFGIGSTINENSFVKNLDPAFSNSYKPVVVFNNYDDNGNITTQQKTDDVKKSYIWGYNSRYPVAEVLGVDYATLMANSNLNQSILQSSSINDEDMRTELNKIRIHFPSSEIITYTYKPLIGLTSQTDVNNRTTYYEYDGFGRLSLVRDQDKNILKKFCYNYSGQPENCDVSIEPNWLANGNYRCVQDAGGENTGDQQREEADNNPNSITYTQKRWVYNGYNTSTCALPACSASNCDNKGDNFKCINDQCEQGNRLNLNSYYDYWLGGYVCIYAYRFSDGSMSQNYTEVNHYPCASE